MMSITTSNIYETHHLTSDEGEEIEVEFEVSAQDGVFLQSLIHERPWITETLEVGCAYGLSSLFICESIAKRQNPHHVIIDPNQSTEYHSVGVSNLRRSHYDFYELIELRSELALPHLVEEGRQFDLIFIDGWHTFDQVMVDAFFATTLLRPNGVLALHDCWMPSISRVVSYLRNYPCYREIGSVPMQIKSKARSASNALIHLFPASLGKRLLPSPMYYRLYNNRTLTAFEKIDTDYRAWDWYGEF